MILKFLKKITLHKLIMILMTATIVASFKYFLGSFDWSNFYENLSLSFTCGLFYVLFSDYILEILKYFKLNINIDELLARPFFMDMGGRVQGPQGNPELSSLGLKPATQDIGSNKYQHAENSVKIKVKKATMKNLSVPTDPLQPIISYLDMKHKILKYLEDTKNLFKEQIEINNAKLSNNLSDEDRVFFNKRSGKLIRDYNSLQEEIFNIENGRVEIIAPQVNIATLTEKAQQLQKLDNKVFNLNFEIPKATTDEERARLDNIQKVLIRTRNRVFTEWNTINNGYINSFYCNRQMDYIDQRLTQDISDKERLELRYHRIYFRKKFEELYTSERGNGLFSKDELKEIKEK